MPQVVGLDIGTSAVRAAELELGSGAPVLTAFSQVGLPPDTVVDGEIQDVTAVADALARLWRNGKFTSKSVVVGIAGLRAITRELDLPWVTDDEVDSAVRFQSEEVIPFAPEKTLLSAQVLGEASAPDGTRTRRVLVAAAHKDLVDGVVAAVERAGLQVAGVDLVSSALVRALVDPKQLSEQPEAIVNVGAGLTVVVVHQEGRPQFVRTLGTGGNAATTAIAQALDLPVSDAELVKRRLDDSTPQLQTAQRATVPVVDELVTEIRNSIQYFTSLPGRSPITRVMVTGGGARLPGFVDRLQAQVRVPVVGASSFEHLDVSGLDLDEESASAVEPVMATPIGLGLPEPNATVRKFNLVPPEVLRKAFERKVTRFAFIGAAAVGVLLVLLGAWRLLAVHNAQNDVGSLTASVAQFQAEVPTYNSVVRAVDELTAARGQVTRLASQAVDWSAVLTQLDSIAPAGLSITTFNGTSTGAPTTAAGAGASAAAPGPAGPAGSIGSMTVAVIGTFADTAHFSPVAEWIDAVSSSKMFDPPSVSSVANAPAGPNTTVTFQSTVSLTSLASLFKNASL
ncbi:MAG: type IV pilus assembly protein PilM [Acidimicrobiales bacterium]